MLRYERKTPGEIIHIDIKKLGRFERPPSINWAIERPATAPVNRARAAAGCQEWL